MMIYSYPYINLSCGILPRIILTVCVGFVIFCVASQTPLAAQSARDLNKRIERLEQELQELQDGSERSVGGLTSDRASSAEVRLLKLEQLVEQLTGQLEETRYGAGQMLKQLRQLSDDMTLRLATLEQSLGVSGAVALAPSPSVANADIREPMPSSAVPVTEAVVPPIDAPLSQPVSSQPQQSSSQAIDGGSLQGALAEGQMVLRIDDQGKALPADPTIIANPATNDIPTPVAPAPTSAPNPPAVSSGQLAALSSPKNVALPDGTPEEQYDYAFKFLTQNDFASAETALRRFILLHPEELLAGNAQYWLGETYYVRGDYKQAAVEFMSGYQKYPNSNKSPDNLLKLGMSMASLGQIQGACTAFSRIAKDYADTSEQILKTAATQSANLMCK